MDAAPAPAGSTTLPEGVPPQPQRGAVEAPAEPSEQREAQPEPMVVTNRFAPFELRMRWSRFVTPPPS
eukprot:COSAG01_NODE_325_length_18790_cov_64.371101_17_plen_68_part_00